MKNTASHMEHQSAKSTEADVLSNFMQRITDLKKNILSRFDEKKISSEIPFEAIKSHFDLYHNDALVELLRELIKADENVGEIEFDFSDDTITIYNSKIEYAYTPEPIEDGVRYAGETCLSPYWHSFGETLDNYDPALRRNKPVLIEKIMELSEQDFEIFGSNLHQQADFLQAAQDMQYCDSEGAYHCVFLKQKDTEYGVLMCREAAEGKLYTGYLPNLDQFEQQMESEQGMNL